MMVLLGQAIPFSAPFTSNGVGATGLTVTVDVWNAAGTEVVTGAAATEVGDGIYRYTLSSAQNTAEGDYHAIFKTTDGAVDQQHVYDRKTSQASVLTLANGVETGFTLRDVLRLMAAVLLGEAVGAETNQIIFRDVGDTKTRVTATVDPYGNRKEVVVDPS
jgi:hypothetical protein